MKVTCFFRVAVGTLTVGCAPERTRSADSSEQPAQSERSSSDAQVERAIADLADPEAGVRDRAEDRLVREGVQILRRCREALETSADEEQRSRLERILLRVEMDVSSDALRRIWADQWFALKKEGVVLGIEHDSASPIGYYEYEEFDDTGNSPPTDEPAILGWSFSSVLTLRQGQQAPSLEMQVRATCRRDWHLSPISVNWSTGTAGPGMAFHFNSRDESCIVVSDPHGRKRESARFRLDTDANLMSLEINASRVVERAAIVERPELTMRIFRCSDRPGGTSREYTVQLQGHDTLTWDGEKVPVLKYSETGAPEDTRDIYFVSKERGLMAGRIRGYEIVRLHGNPSRGEPAPGEK